MDQSPLLDADVLRLTKMNGINGRIRPRSHAPPTAIAHTVAWKTSWKKLKRIAGIVPTGSERTFR
jgi:hypothetical protein